jgi:glycosyltransferase involved in cell wall biosynthesis
VAVFLPSPRAVSGIGERLLPHVRVSTLTYAVVTPVRDEEENLRRLAPVLIAQSMSPSAWVVVDGGSRDGSAAFIERLGAEHGFIRLVRVRCEAATVRGAPIVRSFLAGVDSLAVEPDVVVKLDADVSMEHDYFARLLAAFEADSRLGIASGSAFEQQGGVWRQRHMTRASVWGACRAYRVACLADVSPLEQRMGWDSIDEFRANVRGWHTKTLLDLPFRHHRPEGDREGSRRRAWRTQGRLAHYLGYRPSYLLARVLYNSLRDPAALAMLTGYLAAAAARERRCGDSEALEYLRRQQALRRLPDRAREALGLRSAC